MLLEAIGPRGRCRGGVVMIYWFRRPRVNPSYHPYAREGQAVVCPLLRGRSPTRSVAPKQHWGLGRAFSPAFRAGGLPLGPGSAEHPAERQSLLLVLGARFFSNGSARMGG